MNRNCMKRHFFIDFGKDETNICEMTKKGQKMSFHERRVEIVTQRRIIEIVIDFTEQLNKTLVCNTDKQFKRL